MRPLQLPVPFEVSVNVFGPQYDKVGESRRGSNVFYFLFVESNNAPPMGQHLSLDQRSTKRCPLTLYG